MRAIDQKVTVSNWGNSIIMLPPFSPDFLLVVGLLLDIVGVVSLAVPDVQRASRCFRFGKLREAKDIIEHRGLTSNDIGFKEVIDVFENIQSNFHICSEEIERIEYGPRFSFLSQSITSIDDVDGMILPYPHDDPDILGVDIENRMSVIFEDGRFSRSPKYIYPRIIELIENGERRFRIVGLGFIAAGFILQLTAAWIS